MENNQNDQEYRDFYSALLSILDEESGESEEPKEISIEEILGEDDDNCCDLMSDSTIQGIKVLYKLISEPHTTKFWSDLDKYIDGYADDYQEDNSDQDDTRQYGLAQDL